MDSLADHSMHHMGNNIHGRIDAQPAGGGGGGGGDMMMMMMDHHNLAPNQQAHNHGHSMHGGAAMPDSMGGMMKMYFHYGLGDLVLFKGFVLNSNTSLLLTCLVLFLISILLEFIDYSRGYLSCRCRNMAASSSSYHTPKSRPTDGHQPIGRSTAGWSCCAGTEANMAPDRGDGYESEASQMRRRANNESAGAMHHQHEAKFFPVRTTDPHIYRVLQACLQFLRTGLSLALMLVAMTYNLCLIFPILLGSAVGYYIFYRPALDLKSAVCH